MCASFANGNVRACINGWFLIDGEVRLALALDTHGATGLAVKVSITRPSRMSCAEGVYTGLRIVLSLNAPDPLLVHESVLKLLAVGVAFIRLYPLAPQVSAAGIPMFTVGLAKTSIST